MNLFRNANKQAQEYGYNLLPCTDSFLTTKETFITPFLILNQQLIFSLFWWLVHVHIVCYLALHIIFLTLPVSSIAVCPTSTLFRLPFNFQSVCFFQAHPGDYFGAKTNNVSSPHVYFPAAVNAVPAERTYVKWCLMYHRQRICIWDVPAVQCLKCVSIRHS